MNEHPITELIPPPAAAAAPDPGRLCLFGGPYVIRAGRHLTVPEGSKRLLVFIALHSGRLDRRHVAGTLWPYGDDERAAGNLRSALWRLRGAGIDVVEADKCALWLRAGTTLDVQVLNEWASRLIAGNAGPGDMRVPRWDPDAVDLLPGWYDDWVIFERERIRQRVLHALEALSRELVRRDRCAEAIEVAIDAVGVEPLRESAQRVLIEAHLAEGNLVEARRLYFRYRELVRQELRIEPGKTLTRLIVEAGRPEPTNGRSHHADAGYGENGHSPTAIAGVATVQI